MPLFRVTRLMMVECIAFVDFVDVVHLLLEETTYLLIERKD
jgi:hypothetical protein